LKGPACILQVSRNGELAVVANTYGRKGIVLDLVTGKTTMNLLRDDEDSDVCVYPLAFVDLDDHLRLIHGTAWNRLDVSDAKTGILLTERGPTSYSRDEDRPEHYLNYFHSQLTLSPGQQFIADNGWVWHPLGVVSTWNVPRWLKKNVWESENGDSKMYLTVCDFFWDGPLCWLDDHRLAVWGYGQAVGWMIPAVCIYDIFTGNRDHWFAGPNGSLVFDDYLFSFDKKDGMSLWDIETGERLLCESGFCPVGYHHGAKEFLTLLEDGHIRISRLLQQ
jgi:hypothetical protein